MIRYTWRMRSPFLPAALLALCACSSTSETSTPPPTDSSTDTNVSESSTDTGAADSPKDSKVDDTATTSDSGGDAGSCTGTADVCSDSKLTCQCCPAGGPAVHCTCSTTCTTDGDCKDAARPKCNHEGTNPGFCTTTDFVCCWACE